MAAPVAAAMLAACGDGDSGGSIGVGPPPVTGNTTWEFCTAAATPSWLAVQDGDGAWTRVAPTGTTFTFNIGTRGGVAYVYVASFTSGLTAAGQTPALARGISPALATARLVRDAAAAGQPTRGASRSSATADRTELHVVYGTQAELNTQGTSQCVPGIEKRVTGSVANVAGNQGALIALGSAFAAVENVSVDGTGFVVTGVQDGPVDLVAARVSGTGSTAALDKLIIRRALNPANNSALPVLDFNSTEAFAPAEARLTVGNLGSDDPFVSTSYVTTGTIGAPLFSDAAQGSGPFRYFGIPATKQRAGDLHIAVVFTSPPGETEPQTLDNTRFTGLYFKDPTDRSVTLGGPFAAPAVSTVATAPSVRLRATGPVPAEYARYVRAEFEQVTAPLRIASIGASAAYSSNATTYDLSIPDFTGVAGWDSDWGLKVGMETDWIVTGIGFTGTGVSAPKPADGATIQGAFRVGRVTP
jgi:hypothetical protein